ncbi:MAG: hypothetical protein CME65_11605 [Halobacteriovoraceae bacterium]|nr:hypothetical protein [Halobacteriovoraceae bacterium]|tara:strand:+ start:19808 stop:21340 length:1533 start_codon:yes stop_codon:yes gene_type:complete
MNKSLLSVLSIISLLASLLFIYTLHIQGIHFGGDSLKMLTAGNHFAISELSYWKHVFTQPIHGFTQYRPISIFLYPLLTKYFFDYSYMIFAIWGGGLFFVCLMQMFRLFLKMKFSYSVASLCLILFSSHESFRLLSDPSHQVKYFIPFAILLWLLGNLLSKNSSKKYTALEVFSLAFAIGCHEGSVTFGPVIFLLKYILNFKIYRKDVLYLVPALFYTYYRVFIAGFSKYNFMKIAPEQLPENYYFFAKSLIANYFFSNKVISILFFLCLVMFWLFNSPQQKTKKIVMGILFWFAIMFPFSVIFNHQYEDRVLWTVILAPLLLGHMLEFSRMSRLKNLYNFVLPVILIICFFKIPLDFGRDPSYKLKAFVTEKLRPYKSGEFVKLEITEISNFAFHDYLPGLISYIRPDLMVGIDNDKFSSTPYGRVSIFTAQGSYYTQFTDLVSEYRNYWDKQRVQHKFVENGKKFYSFGPFHYPSICLVPKDKELAKIIKLDLSSYKVLQYSSLDADE